MSDIVIRPLENSDHADWRRLWTAYLVFYKATVSEEVYATTWKRLFDPGEFEPKGFLALVDGKAVGLVHYLYHRTCWSVTNNCYLQDLFADPAVRGTGVGRASDRGGAGGSGQDRRRQRLLDDARDQRNGPQASTTASPGGQGSSNTTCCPEEYRYSGQAGLQTAVACQALRASSQRSTSASSSSRPLSLRRDLLAAVNSSASRPSSQDSITSGWM